MWVGEQYWEHLQSSFEVSQSASGDRYKCVLRYSRPRKKAKNFCYLHVIKIKISETFPSWNAKPAIRMGSWRNRKSNKCWIFSVIGFQRNAALVLEQQISGVYDDKFLREAGSKIPDSHPMHTRISVSTREAVQEHIKSSDKLSQYGKLLRMINRILLLKLYRSIVAFLKRSCELVPNYLILFTERCQSFLNEWAGFRCNQERPFLGISGSVLLQHPWLDTGQFEITRPLKRRNATFIRWMHRKLVKASCWKTHCGHECQIKRSTHIRLHPPLTSYVADIY